MFQAVVVPCGVVWLKLLLYIDIVLILFHILILQENWVLAETSIPLKPLLAGVRIVALSISSHEHTH